MDNKRNNKIEDILNSLDGSRKATVPDFFYTRLKARMEKGLAPEKNRSWQLKPVYVIASLLVILAVNAAVLLKGKDEPNSILTADNNNETAQQSIAAEYNVFDNNIMYDLNQDK